MDFKSIGACFNDDAFVLHHGTDARKWSQDIRLQFCQNIHRHCQFGKCSVADMAPGKGNDGANDVTRQRQGIDKTPSSCNTSFAPSFPLPGATMSPTQNAFETDLEGNWILARKLDLSEALSTELGVSRQWYDGLSFYKGAWPLVENIMFNILREDSMFDCFWDFNYPASFPQTKKKNGGAWNMAGSPFPATPFLPFGIEYSCDFRRFCGCPRMLRIMQVSPDGTFAIYIKNVHVRHGCMHTMSKDKIGSTFDKGDTPSLHVALKAFIRQRVFANVGGNPLVWGVIKEEVATYIKHKMFLYCQFPHYQRDKHTTKQGQGEV